MIRAYPVDAVRAAEAVLLARTPEGALMQRAAAGLAATCARLLRAARGRVTGACVVLLVGSGNNGGDALWAGARLAARGARVDAVLLGRAHPGGLAGLRAAGGRVVDPAARAAGLLGRADLVLDGLVGLGGAPGLREPAAGLVAAIGERALVVAVDLPSGVDPDTGATPAAHVRADVTVTFGAVKPCLLLPPAAHAAGVIDVVDLGLGPHLPAGPAVERLEDADAATLLPLPGPDAHKYSRGVVGVVAGSADYTGAAVLCVAGAARAGAGMVRYLGTEQAADQVRAAWPEVVVDDRDDPGRVQAWAVGSGLDLERGGGDEGQRAAVERALVSGEPCVVDAGALALLRWGVRPAGAALLTPHAGELARLLDVTRDTVEAQPAQQARRAAARFGATVLLKGSVTVVAAADGRLRSQQDATPWLATAGAGDVLAGIAAAYLAAGLDAFDAAALAALVHGRAARAAAGVHGPAGGPVVASDVAAAVPGVVGALLGSRSVVG